MEGVEGVEGIGDLVPRACTTICLGSSGRGVYAVGRELRLVSPFPVRILLCDLRVGQPAFEKGEALYLVDQHLQRDLHSDGDANVENGMDDVRWCGDKLDFDEGMGRFVGANESGFEVVQLD